MRELLEKGNLSEIHKTFVLEKTYVNQWIGDKKCG